MTEHDLGARMIGLTPTLYKVSCSLLSREADREDAVQAAIEKAWKKAKNLKDEAKLKPWMVRILINECHNIGRRCKREIPAEVLPEGITQENDEARFLRDALLLLSPQVRIPIVLHYMEGFSAGEIAFMLRCPKGTVLSRMDRGRKQLKTLLSKE